MEDEVAVARGAALSRCWTTQIGFRYPPYLHYSASACPKSIPLIACILDQKRTKAEAYETDESRTVLH